MLSESDMNRMRLILMPGKSPPPHLDEYYLKAYECWRQVWKDTFVELNGNDQIYSDDFVRQDEVCAIFLDDICLATTFFNWVDFRFPTAQDDSYFKVWTIDAIAKLTKHNPVVLVCSYFTLNLKCRRGALGLNMKEILLSAIVRRFQDTDVRSMTGTVRNNRGVNTVCYRHGAEPLEKDLTLHGVEVDLLAFYQETVSLSSDPVVAKVVNHMWDRRITSKDVSEHLRRVA